MDMNRIDERFKKLKEENKKALIPYICCGDPSVEDSEKLVYALEEAGADIIELGIPYSDPLADGPVIQAAGLRAFAGGFRLEDTFKIVKNVRKNSQIPLVIMVYYSSIIGFGKEKFVELCVDADVDGLIVPDLPYEEYDELKPLLDKTNVYMIPLVRALYTAYLLLVLQVLERNLIQELTALLLRLRKLQILQLVSVSVFLQRLMLKDLTKLQTVVL